MINGKEFKEYSLHDHLQQALDKLGFQNCTPIQDLAFPIVLNGKDVAGLAQTGTGKTAAFMLPLIERVFRAGSETGNEEIDARGFKDWKHNHFNLVLVPTRELAEQVKDCALDFLKGSDHKVVAVYGGMPIDKQIKELEKGFSFLVATPGRLIDLYKEHKVDLKQVRAVVFDEADRMFDMGFKDDMKYVLRRIPEERQLLLFSATLNLDVFNVAYQFGADPVEIKVSQDKATADNVEDKIFHLGRDEKPSHLLALINKHQPKQVIIFTNFKSNVERVAEFLNSNGQKAAGISSLLSQAQRKRVMERFRGDDGENILVATDVAARGLDIEGVDMVINFELPDDAENYVHRIGRTGRAGEKGKAFSFVSDKDVEALSRIKSYLKREVETDWMETDDLPTDFKAFPRGEPMMKRSRTQRPSAKGGRNNNRRPDSKDRKDTRSKSVDRNKSRDKDRDKDYDKNKKKRRTYNNKSSDEKNDEKQVHRDKRSGRHHAKKKDFSSSSKKKTYKSSSEKKKSGNSNKSQQKKRPARRRQSVKKTGIVSKVASAFKGLFK